MKETHVSCGACRHRRARDVLRVLRFGWRRRRQGAGRTQLSTPRCPRSSMPVAANAGSSSAARGSHIRSEPSLLPVASSVPSGLHCIVCTCGASRVGLEHHMSPRTSPSNLLQTPQRTPPGKSPRRDDLAAPRLGSPRSAGNSLSRTPPPCRPCCRPPADCLWAATGMSARPDRTSKWCATRTPSGRRLHEGLSACRPATMRSSMPQGGAASSEVCGISSKRA